MALHPQVEQFLADWNRLDLQPFESTPVPELRRRTEATGLLAACPTLAAIDDHRIPREDGTTLRVRVYRPFGDGPLPVCLYFHGGGWVINTIDTHDDLVRRLTAESGCVFVSVDYRLAPEHKYPAAIEDAWTALKAVVEHADDWDIDATRIGVAGDSAGGNLAAALALMTRDRGGPELSAQILIYPITDCDFTRPSYVENAEGYFLTTAQMKWFWNQYVERPEQMLEPYASPLRAESLKRLPPAFVITAEYDPLRDEGEAYADALFENEVPVSLHRFSGLIHAFIRRVDTFDAATSAIREVGFSLRKWLNE